MNNKELSFVTETLECVREDMRRHKMSRIIKELVRVAFDVHLLIHSPLPSCHPSMKSVYRLTMEIPRILGKFSTMWSRIEEIEDALHTDTCKHKTMVHVLAVWLHICLVCGTVGKNFLPDNTFAS